MIVYCFEKENPSLYTSPLTSKRKIVKQTKLKADKANKVEIRVVKLKA